MRTMIIIGYLSVSLLAGCGQKGPLYIEQDKPLPAVTPAADNQPGDEEKRKDKQSAQ